MHVLLTMHLYAKHNECVSVFLRKFLMRYMENFVKHTNLYKIFAIVYTKTLFSSNTIFNKKHKRCILHIKIYESFFSVCVDNDVSLGL